MLPAAAAAGVPFTSAPVTTGSASYGLPIITPVMQSFKERGFQLNSNMRNACLLFDSILSGLTDEAIRLETVNQITHAFP